MSSPSNILFIDANHQDCDYYSQRLRISSPDSVVIQAATGRVGLAICNSQTIDCVVLELDLPDMSGFEVLLKLVPRARHPEIAVIVFTRLSNPYLLDAAVSNGAQAALHKSMASGDILDQTILRAVSAVPRKRTEPSHFAV